MFIAKQPQGENDADGRCDSGAGRRARRLLAAGSGDVRAHGVRRSEPGTHAREYEHAACVQWLAKHPPGVLLAIGGGMLEPVTAAPDSYEN